MPGAMHVRPGEDRQMRVPEAQPRAQGPQQHHCFVSRDDALLSFLLLFFEGGGDLEVLSVAKCALFLSFLGREDFWIMVVSEALAF